MDNSNLISGIELMAKYRISRHKLANLVFTNKLCPVKGAQHHTYNKIQVEKYFRKLKQIESLPKIISSKDVIVKYKLSRVEFAQLVTDGKLKPLPLNYEQNLHFEYEAVYQYFENNK